MVTLRIQISFRTLSQTCFVSSLPLLFSFSASYSYSYSYLLSLSLPSFLLMHNSDDFFVFRLFDFYFDLSNHLDFGFGGGHILISMFREFLFLFLFSSYLCLRYGSQRKKGWKDERKERREDYWVTCWSVNGSLIIWNVRSVGGVTWLDVIGFSCNWRISLLLLLLLRYQVSTILNFTIFLFNVFICTQF